MPITNFDIEKGVATFVGGYISTSKHVHHALEIIISTSGTFDFFTEDIEYKKIKAIAVLPDIPHTFIGKNGQYEFTYIDSNLCTLDFLIKELEFEQKKVTCLDIFLARHSIEKLKEIINNSLVLNKGTMGKKIIDSRVIQCQKIIIDKVKNEKISLNELANSVFLSKSRLSHLFKKQMGISIQNFILWNRLKVAITAIVKGNNLTQAAHIGRFSDSAHFSKKFKKTFGVNPSILLKE